MTAVIPLNDSTERHLAALCDMLIRYGIPFGKSFII